MEPDLLASPFRAIPRERVKDQALEQLKQYIASGAVTAGGRLPSERDLAKRLGVGRNSVREAVKVLEALGIVESRVGEGTFIVDAAGASLGRTIGFALATWGGTLVELLQARQMIESEAARFAARRAEPADLAAILAEVDQMEAAGDDLYAYLAADMRFHRRIAAATHNAIAAGLVANLIDALEEVLRELRADQIATVAEGTATHRDIYAALAAGDADAAHHRMRVHLQFSTDLWTAVASLGSGPEPAPA